MNRKVSKEISKYFSILGKKGGSVSKRTLSTEDAIKMVKIRESKKRKMAKIAKKNEKSKKKGEYKVWQRTKRNLKK